MHTATAPRIKTVRNVAEQKTAAPNEAAARRSKPTVTSVGY